MEQAADGAGGAIDPESLWTRIQEAATTNAARALLGALRLVSYEDGAARIASTSPRGSGFLRSRRERLEELFSRAAGRPVRVEIVDAGDEEAASEPAPERPSAEIDPKLLEHPVVRDAIELFNAHVARVEPNAEESSTRSA